MEIPHSEGRNFRQMSLGYVLFLFFEYMQIISADKFYTFVDVSKFISSLAYIFSLKTNSFDDLFFTES